MGAFIVNWGERKHVGWGRRLVVAGFVWVRVMLVGVRFMFVNSRVVSVGVRAMFVGVSVVSIDVRVMFVDSRVVSIGVRVVFVGVRVMSVSVRAVARVARSVVADERAAKSWDMLLDWPVRPRGGNMIKEGTTKHACFVSPASTPAAGHLLWWLWHG